MRHITCEEEGIGPKSIIGELAYQQGGIAQGKRVSIWIENLIIFIMALCTFDVDNVVEIFKEGSRTANQSMELFPTDLSPD